MAGATTSTAIEGGGQSRITIQNIQVDGQRPQLGRIEGGGGLMELGGDTEGVTVHNVHAFDPRGWSALHIAEGGLRRTAQGLQPDDQPRGYGHRQHPRR
ncbi:hypothetical protein AB0J83_17505 [Actinoplanes sp. NPDC049596]|uniref:hypothetical protein n=1 Tax=unclassified Actinoplanes TaxID=2626549 RepID=UPI003412304A